MGLIHDKAKWSLKLICNIAGKSKDRSDRFLSDKKSGMLERSGKHVYNCEDLWGRYLESMFATVGDGNEEVMLLSSDRFQFLWSGDMDDAMDDAMEDAMDAMVYSKESDQLP